MSATQHIGVFTVALKCKTQQQIRKHDNKTENTMANQKIQPQIRKHNTLTKTEKVGTLGRHESSLIGLVRPLNWKDMTYMFSKQERRQ